MNTRSFPNRLPLLIWDETRKQDGGNHFRRLKSDLPLTDQQCIVSSRWHDEPDRPDYVDHLYRAVPAVHAVVVHQRDFVVFVATAAVWEAELYNAIRDALEGFFRQLPLSLAA